MANELYNAFMKAGFKTEANMLSTTIDGRITPGLGYCILRVENPHGAANEHGNFQDYHNSRRKISEFVKGNLETFKLKPEHADLHDWQIIQEISK